MSAPPLTLVDFLFARITEDKVTATIASANAYAGIGQVLVSNPGIWPDEPWLYKFRPDREIKIAERVLADCDLKLGIVGYFLGHEKVAAEQDTPIKGALAEIAAVTLGDVLKMIAMPYADHPDFQPEWRRA